MKRRSRGSGNQAKALRRKAETPRRRSAPESGGARGSSVPGKETDVARLTRERDEALEQQRATAEVLKIISASPTELQPVLEVVVRSAARFCQANDATIYELDGQDLRIAAHWGAVPQEIGGRFPCTRGSVAGRAVLERKPFHVTDLQAEVEEFPEGSAMARRVGHRTTASVPLLREGMAAGAISLRRAEVKPFADKQIALLGTFAAQAVIAIENTRLIAELRQRTDQLGRSVAELQRERNNKLMNMEAMAASISHEVRQPLASIATHGSAALRFLENMPPNVEEVRSALNWMISDSNRASQIFDNIRALFGKADEGRKPIDVNDLIRGVLTSFQEELEDNGISAGVRLPGDLPKIIAHKGQLQEVLINLVRNAIEAMQADKNDHRVLQVSSGRHGDDKIILSIEDSGPGIDPKHAKNIFDAFVTTKSDGMGLGLALCRMIIERHSGELMASPTHPRGSIFRVALPISPATR